MTKRCAIADGGDFNEADSQSRNPFRKNPGVDGAISDTPPDMRLKPPMRGEVDHTPNRRNSIMDSPRVGNWKKPLNLQAEKSGNKLSHGDFLVGKNPNY